MVNKTKKTRRELLALAAIAGAGIFAGSGIKKIIPSEIKQTTILMTADGKLVEVEREHLPATTNKKSLTNDELKEWMKNNKTFNIENSI